MCVALEMFFFWWKKKECLESANAFPQFDMQMRVKTSNRGNIKDKKRISL